MENNAKSFGKFSGLPYSRPDAKKFKKDLEKIIASGRKATTFEDVDKAFLSFMRAYEMWATTVTIASIRNTMNMADEFYDKEMEFFNTENSKLMLTMKKAIKFLLSTPYRPQLEEKYGSHMFKNYEVEMKHIKLSIVLPSIKEGKLGKEYSKTIAGCSVDFMGEKCNIYGLLRHMESTDRNERKAAFESFAKLFEGVASKLEDQYAQLVKIRCDIAKKLGYDNFIDYVYPARGRYDYNAEKVSAFRDAVAKYITPLADRLFMDLFFKPAS